MAKEYLLMKRNKPVAGIVFNSRWEIVECFERRGASLPEGPFMCYSDKKLDAGLLNRWFKARMISPMRAQYGRIKEVLGTEYLQEAAVGGYGLSLFDSYWIKPEGSPKGWEEVNLFSHPYSNGLSVALADPDFSGFVKPAPNPSLFVPGHYNYVFECVAKKSSGNELTDKKTDNKKANYLFCFEEPEYVLTEYFLHTECAGLFGLLSLRYSMFDTKDGFKAITAPIFTSEAVSYIPASMLILGKNAIFNQDNVKTPYNLILARLREVSEIYKLDVKDCLDKLHRLFLFDTLFQVSDRQLFHFGYLIDEKNKKVTLSPVINSGRGLGHMMEVVRNTSCLYPLFGEPLVWNVLKIKDLEKVFSQIPFDKLKKLPEQCHKQFETLDPILADEKATRLEKRIEMFPELVAAILEKRANNYRKLTKIQ